MGMVTGKPGRDPNVWGEALVLKLLVVAGRVRGRELTLGELAEALECVALLCDPTVDDDDIPDVAARLATTVGDPAWVRGKVAAWRRLAHDRDPHPEVARLVAGELRRVATLSAYRQRARRVALASARRTTRPACCRHAGATLSAIRRQYVLRDRIVREVAVLVAETAARAVRDVRRAVPDYVPASVRPLNGAVRGGARWAG